MSIIFLDFSRNYEEAKTGKKYFFSYSLKDQYETLKSRIPSHKNQTSSLRDLIEICFSTNLVKKYYFTCSNFRRAKFTQDNGIQFLNNVVIRPELTPQMTNYLPDNTNIILIGDIQESERLNSFIVKGIEFVDKNISGTNDIVESNSFCTNTFGHALSSNGKKYVSWSIDRPDLNKTLFSPDFISYLISSCYPMSQKNLQHVVKAYDEWNDYLVFRMDYLNYQANRHFLIDGSELIRAFSIDKKTYYRNQEKYDIDILVNHEAFKKGEQILLKNPTENSEELYLIVVNKDYNKKEFEKSSIKNKKGNVFNQEERALKGFTRENLSLSKGIPNAQKNYEKVLSEAFSLDERYRFIYMDIEPDCSKLTINYNKLIEKEHKNIDDRYNLIIRKELNNALDSEKELLFDRIKVELNDFDKNFAENLDKMVQYNDDSNIKKQIEKLIENKAKKLKEYLNKEIKKISKKDNDYNKIKNNLEQKYREDLIAYRKSINIRELFIKRHNDEKTVLNNKLNEEYKINIANFEKQKKLQLDNKYSEAILIEKTQIKNKLNIECKEKIDEKIANETIRRFLIYFKVNIDNPESFSSGRFEGYKYLIYDYRADKAKVDRQKTALESFYEGNVKNPYLATYLFAPDELNKTYYDFSDWEWYLESLNDKQREAVKKAVSSKGIFLLQGPPGTGKTQVIAEIVGHLAKEGRKVLVASETHKAIDNVFERLPLTADIRPLRLVASKSNKGTDFGPENLVDNFYSNIAKKMLSVINKYENFSEYKENFYENYQKQKLICDKIIGNKHNIEKIKNEINNYQVVVNDLKNQKQRLVDSLEIIEQDKIRFIRTKNRLDNLKLDYLEDLEYGLIDDFKKEAISLISKKNIFNLEDANVIILNIIMADIKTIEEEIRLIRIESDKFDREQKMKDIRAKLMSYQDEYGNWIKGSDISVKSLQMELKELLDQNPSNNYSNLLITNIIKDIRSVNLNDLSDIVQATRYSLLELKSKKLKPIEDKVYELNVDIDKLQLKINDLNKKMLSIQDKIRDLQEDSNYRSIQDDEAKLRREIASFIETFNVVIEYKDYQDAIVKIYQEYLLLEKEFEKNENENKRLIPIYKKISDYLLKEEVIFADRLDYTKPLFDKVNLFGITNTSRDNFSESSNEALSNYSLGNVDLKKQGIDVVVIDEVSKSSFLDLLIPILYGKTVILVGDHRQLSPMYEFRNLRKDDFDNIDEEILTEYKNNKYKNMYEESFFKTLFERVPVDYKVMLNQQYRSHEHIMQVYNCFYNNQLQIGYEGQNNAKEHHLTIKSNNRIIIEPNKHVYFVDCKKYESRDNDSTSIYNSNEADVIVKLLKMINDSYKANPVIKFNRNNGIDERMSMGVICTYGDQAKIIKNKLKNANMKFDMFYEKADGRMIINTVDDFQGDERDIIILSMVRNPSNRAKADPGFILTYQRINVALSRARRLLIVVGNKDYLESKGIIDLPDVFGQGDDRKNFHVYRDIISSIMKYGNVIDDEDVLGGEK